jgi:AGCS family alanine or glycine:cation symporter
MLIILVGGGIFLTVRLGFFQFTHFGYIMRQTYGKMFKKSIEGEGTVTPFQAATSALASTVGASNIVGVPVAIALGEPGAVLWMWNTALLGSASKFSEVVLGLKYRGINEKGHYVGGPMYYIEKGLGWKLLSTLFALFLMLEIITEHHGPGKFSCWLGFHSWDSANSNRHSDYDSGGPRRCGRH